MSEKDKVKPSSIPDAPNIPDPPAPKKRKRSGKPNELDPHSIPAMYLAEIKDEFIDPDYDPDEELTISENKFCVEFVACKVQTKAYQRAYPDAKYHSAIARSSELISRPKIARRINNLQRDQNIRCLNPADEVLRRVVRRAKADIRDLVDSTGATIPPHKLDPDIAVAIKEFKCVEREDGEDGIKRTWEYKLIDPLKADEMLARNHKLLTDRVEHIEGGTQEENDQRAKEVLAGLIAEANKK